MIRYQFTAGGYAFFRDDESRRWNVSGDRAAPPSHCAYASPEAIAALKGIAGAVLPVERAREINRAQNQFPHWGNFRRFMSPAEIEITEAAWNTATGGFSFASIVRAFAALDYIHIESGEDS